MSASPLEMRTLTRPLGPPAASLTFGAIFRCDAELLEHPHDMRRRDAAAGGRGVAHAPCREQRLLERFGRGHIRFGRALAHGDADPGAREVGATRNDLALFDELVDGRAVGQENVGGLPGVEAGDQRAGGGRNSRGWCDRSARSKGGSNSSVAAFSAVEMSALISAASAALGMSNARTTASMRMMNEPVSNCARLAP